VREDDAEVEVGPPTVWVFHGEEARFASGVFKDRDAALKWVELHRLTGIVTEYPIGVGCYDVAVAEGFFQPSKPHHGTPVHVAGFSPPGDHIHVQDRAPSVVARHPPTRCRRQIRMASWQDFGFVRRGCQRSFCSCPRLVAAGFVGGHAFGGIFHRRSLIWVSLARARATAEPTSGTARMTRSSTATTVRWVTGSTMPSIFDRHAESVGVTERNQIPACCAQMPRQNSATPEAFDLIGLDDRPGRCSELGFIWEKTLRNQ
jgi:hypothetical protein